MAFRENRYLLDLGDIQFLKQGEAACDFSFENNSARELFRVINAGSVEDVLRQAPYATMLNQLWVNQNQSLNNTNMNQQNLDYLKENLKYMGFGEQLNESLQNSILEGKKEFTLHLDTEVGKKPFSADLYFKRSENMDMYFFNRWDAKLMTDGTKQQTFYVNKGHGVTLKEGFNLLEGRAVHKELTSKEGEKYHAWLQLDRKEMDVNGNFKVNQYHNNYGYDLEKTLNQLPIKELSNADQKDMLLKSLSKGNLQAVTFEKNGMADKLFISASPQYKSVDVYDATGAAIWMSNLEKRFDFSFRQSEGAAVALKGRAKQRVNNTPVEGANEMQLSAGGNEFSGQKDDQKPLQKAAKEFKGESLLPKKAKSGGLSGEKSTSKGRGLHA
jgi:hypothetical protein